MPDFAAQVIPIRIEDEMRNSYMDYSMSVIIGRALPGRARRSEARPPPHPVRHAPRRAPGQQEVQQVRRRRRRGAQEVPSRTATRRSTTRSCAWPSPGTSGTPLVDGQGNFGSVDGDPAAAYRYTECKMTKLAEELLVDIDKETVNWSPNFDGHGRRARRCCRAAFPNLLVNGADGIAVGMATNIPPHNLGEIIDAAVALIDNPEIDLDELMEYHARVRTFPPAAPSTARRVSATPTRPVAVGSSSAATPPSRICRAASAPSSSTSCPTR